MSELLRRLAHEVYQRRPILPLEERTNYRIERVNGGFLCDLWFLTTGCLHDAAGGCVMCNYGRGSPTARPEEERILSELARIVRELPWRFEDFLLTSSGSILDPREVSPEMREGLLPILAQVRARRFVVETRADTVTDDGLLFLTRAMPAAETYVEIGLESSSDWVLNYCLNKGSTFAVFRDAVRKAHARQIRVTANVGLGIPFLSERAAIQEAVRTTRDALQAGADSVILFPYHVKHGTLLDVMYRNGLYHCVSLWALVRALQALADVRDRVQISWYKDYFGEKRSFIYSSPGTCPRCAAAVTALLDQYRDQPTQASVDRLAGYSCACRDTWAGTLEGQSAAIEPDRVAALYRRLAALFRVEEAALERELSRMTREYEELAE